MKEDAVSELLGALLLISLVMIGIGLLGVFLLSTPPPESSPQISLGVACCNCLDGTTRNILITHAGGTAISYSDLNIYLDQVKRESYEVYSAPMGSCNGTGESWIVATDQVFSTGDTIRLLPNPKEIHNVRIMTNASEKMIFNSSFSCDNSCGY